MPMLSRCAVCSIKNDLSPQRKEHNEKRDNLIKTVFSFYYLAGFLVANASPSGFVILSPEDEKRHQQAKPADF